MSAFFGPAGNSLSFKEMGYKKTIEVPQYLKKMELDAYEYQCGRGVKISLKSAQEFGQEAKNNGIKISIHAPYFISLSSLEEEKRKNSINYILDTAKVADAMGADRIVIHSGSCSKISRQEALELAKETMKNACDALEQNGFSHIIPCPETMGKINQLGNLAEVIELCKIDDKMIPCIDFGHLNARTFGKIKSIEDYKYIFDTIENELGSERLKQFHAHFSKIEYTQKGGEKKHLTFEDNVYGPDFEPLLELITIKKCSPTIICESAGTQAEDAREMKNYYNTL